jgi:hypothetical protein
MVVYYVSLYVSSSDELVSLGPSDPSQTECLSVMDAVVRSRASESLVFVTTENAHQYNTRRLREPAPSLNTQGGAQYVHVLGSSWVRLGLGTDRVFLEGDTAVRAFRRSAVKPRFRTRDHGSDGTRSGRGRTARPPSSYTSTPGRIQQCVYLRDCSGSVFDFTNQFHLVTIALHEVAVTAEVNGTTCKIYVDQTMEQRTFAGETLKERREAVCPPHLRQWAEVPPKDG